MWRVRRNDVVMDRGRTTHVPAIENPGKNPVQFFTDPLLTDAFWPEPIEKEKKDNLA